MPPGLKLPGVFSELAVHSADIAEAVGKPFDLRDLLDLTRQLTLRVRDARA